jgi:glycosyltransferase involved in cell wall biosynthesis
MGPLMKGGKGMRLVSVVIPTRNRSALLTEAIESVLAVDREDFEIEVIVVDDGSVDDTPTVARNYPVTYVRTEGIGVSAARNVGMHAAHGEFIAFLDDDDIWLASNVGVHLRVFDQHPEYGAVIAQVRLTDAHRVPYGQAMPSRPVRSGWIFDDLLAYWPQLGSVVVRASVFQEVGGFEPSLRSAEDWEWVLRIAQRYPIGRLAVPVVLFRQRQYGDPEYVTEETEWQRLRVVRQIFHLRTRDCAPYRRVRLQRVLWAHRGWYASLFVQKARNRMQGGNRPRALRCLYYALRSSPVHLLILLARSVPSWADWRSV